MREYFIHRVKPFIFLLSILPLILSMTEDKKNLCGTYVIVDSEWGEHKLILKKNGNFIETVSGCVYTIQTKGKWEVTSDTLILHELKRKDLRSKMQIKASERTERLIVRDDSLYEVNEENPERTFDIYSCLVRKK